MKRTPINERVLPNYTHSEEVMNMVSHIVGGGLGIVILVLGIIIAVGHRNPWAVVSVTVYGVSMIWLYTMSSVYHGLHPGRAKKIMQIIDHCTIYVLIAGTYTPILLSAIRPEHPALTWTVFGCEWGFALLAATFTAIDLKKYNRFSMICYIAMGWFIILCVKPTIDAISAAGFAWLLAGGIAYTVGAVLYHQGKSRRYYHSVFHIFVVLGSVLQAVCILGYTI